MRIGMTHFRKATHGLLVAALVGVLWSQPAPRSALAQDAPAAPAVRVSVGDAVRVVSPTMKLEVIERQEDPPDAIDRQRC